MNSVEVVIIPHSNDHGPFFRGTTMGPFSEGGDSGSIIVDAERRLVALLTGRAGKTDYWDLTFGTPMHWLWQVILDKFPGADLYWDDKDMTNWVRLFFDIACSQLTTSRPC